MDTWVVSRNPIGVHRSPSTAEAAEKSQVRSYTYVIRVDAETLQLFKECLFFYKAHVLAGQAHADGKNILDFAWLTKEEIQTRVDKGYCESVKDMISDF